MLVGPLDISYCLFFYILSIGSLFICFCLFILLILNLKIFKRKTEICVLLILFFMLFIENRLLYSMCLNDTTNEIFLSKPSQFDQKKKGLTDLKVRDKTVDDLYNMLARIIDVTLATTNPIKVDAIARFVTEVESGKRDRPTGYTLTDYGASAKDVDQLYGALNNAFNQTNNKRELSSRIRKPGGLFMAMIDSEKELIIARDKEIERARLDNLRQAALETVSRKYEDLLGDVRRINNQIGNANISMDLINTSLNTSLTTNQTLSKYVQKHGNLWQEKYPKIQTEMDVITSKLNNISKNTKPLQFSYVINKINT